MKRKIDDDDKVYGGNSQVRIDEDHQCGDDRPYQECTVPAIYVTELSPIAGPRMIEKRPVTLYTTGNCPWSGQCCEWQMRC